MAITVSRNGSANSAGGTGTSLTATLAIASIAVSDAVLVWVNAAGGVTSVTDSQGNTYVQLQGSSPNGNAALECWICPYVATALVSGTDTVTAHYNSSTDAVVFINRVQGGNGPYLDAGSTNSGNSGSPSAGPTATLTSASDVAVEASAYGNNSTYTPSGGWTSLVGSANANMSLRADALALSSTAGVSASPTIATTGVSWSCAVVVLHQGSSGVTLGVISLAVALPAPTKAGAASTSLGLVALSVSAPNVAATGAGTVTTGSVALAVSTPAITAKGAGTAGLGLLTLAVAEPIVSAYGGASSVTLSPIALTITLLATVETVVVVPLGYAYRTINPS